MALAAAADAIGRDDDFMDAGGTALMRRGEGRSKEASGMYVIGEARLKQYL
jgi:hypothetical protein